MPNDIYHCCRWCKWFEKGLCTNDKAFEDADDIEFYPFAEDGTLSEAINEGFKAVKFDRVRNALIESKLSKKKQDEIMQVLHSELEDAQINWTETIDEQVLGALQHYDFQETHGVKIADPHEFHCKYFW